MRIISISLDNGILDSNSPTFKRMAEYAVSFDEMHIICCTVNTKASYFQQKNLFIYPTQSKSKIRCIIDAYIVGKKILLKENLDKKDLIITTQDPFETALIGYFLKKKFNIPLNIQDHGNFFESKYFKQESILNFFRYFLGRYLLKKSDSIRTVSLRERKFIEKNVPYDTNKIINIPIFTDWKQNSLQAPKLNIKQRYPGFDFYILTICRLEKVKNIPLLLRAFSEIKTDFPNILLTIVGSGSQKNKIKDLINLSDLQDNVILEDWTSDTISYYKSSDLFVLSSFSEGWGLTVIEAVSAHCPVIMTDTGCAQEFIKNTVNGWVVKINDTRDLIRALKDALKNKEKGIRFAEKAFRDLSFLPDKDTTIRQLKKSWEISLT